MKKALPLVLVASFALLLVMGFHFSVANARHIPFCPIECSVYVADDGSVLLAPLASDGNYIEKANLDGTTYVRQEMESTVSETLVKKLCVDSCMIYKIDGEDAVAAYKASIQ